MVKIKGFKSFQVEQDKANELCITTEQTNINQDSLNLVFSKQDSFLKIVLPEREYNQKKFNQLNKTEMIKNGKHYLQNYLRKGYYKEKPEELIYVYQMKTKKVFQTSFLCSISKSDYLNKNIIPHEEILPHKKDNILKITKELGIYISYPQTFTSFPKQLSDYLKLIIEGKDPIYDIQKNDVQHIIYITTKEESQKIVKMSKLIENVIIADGHHRLECYFELSKNNKENKNEQFVPLMICNRDEMSMSRFTRIMFSQNHLEVDQILNLAGKVFKVTEIEIPEEIQINKKERLNNFIDNIKSRNFRVYFSEIKKWFNFEAPKISIKNKVQNLDSVYINENFIKEILNVDPNDRSQIEYIECYKSTPFYIEERLNNDKDAKIAIIYANIDIEVIESIAKNNHFLPPKTTCFYPKPLLGFMFTKL